MKNFTKKIFKGILPLIFVIASFMVFSSIADASEEQRVVRVCNNGICIVTIYSSDGAIVNVYEELDIHP